MADKTKEQLSALNDANFPNNNSGFITPQKLRDFNQDMIDSMVTDIDSILTGSITVDGTITATEFVGDGSGITGVLSQVPQGTVSGSSQLTSSYDERYTLSGSVQPLPEGLISGSSQIDYPLISNIPSGIISSSEQLPSGLVSGSSQVSYPELSNIPSGIVSSSSQVVLEDTTFTDNGADSFLQTDGAGNLSFQYVKSMYEEIKNRESFEIQRGQALYVDSNTGDRVDVYLADNSNPNRFPATLIASENISANGNGLGLIAGLIDSIDVGTLQAGDIVYLGNNGGWTNVRPTGSADIQVLGVVSRPGNNGAGYFINQLHTTLPNIAEGNAWVGDANGVPQQVSTASWDAHSDLTQ